MTPTQRTLKALRDRGAICGIVERFNQYAGQYGIRQDLFGFIDIIAIEPALKQITGVQSTGSAFSMHLHMILVERKEPAMQWLISGGRIELWGWRKLKVKRGGKAMVWTPRMREIVLTDFERVEVKTPT